jgi:hypothetical protein
MRRADEVTVVRVMAVLLLSDTGVAAEAHAVDADDSVVARLSQLQQSFHRPDDRAPRSGRSM